MNLRELRCRNCGAPIAPENIVEHLSMARCGHCNAVFTLDLPDNDDKPSPKVLRPKVPLPKSMQMEDMGSALEIRRRWFGASAFFLLFFAVFWNGFMIVWHGIALSQGIWFMSLFGLLHTAVGIGVAYTTLAMFLNTTYIRAGNGMIQVEIKPLPWSGNKWIEADNLTQLYCTEKTHRGKNGTRYSYSVMAIRDNDSRETVLEGLEDLDQAMYVEQELERFLGISDETVYGEARR